MEDLQLPPELERLEHLLMCGPCPEPSAALRRRILSSVGSELRSKQVLPRWRLAATFAAVLLVGLSLSFGILQATIFAMQPHPTLCEVAKRLQRLSPGLSREESLRQAALRQIGVEAACPMLLGDIPATCDCP